jgi:hypothetical protein
MIIVTNMFGRSIVPILLYIMDFIKVFERKKDKIKDGLVTSVDQG